jgi:hypothetical protein
MLGSCVCVCSREELDVPATGRREGRLVWLARKVRERATSAPLMAGLIVLCSMITIKVRTVVNGKLPCEEYCRMYVCMYVSLRFD